MIRELEAQRSSGGNYTYDTAKEIWAAYANLVILPSTENGDSDAQLAWNNNPGWAVDDTDAASSTKTWVEIYNAVQGSISA